jgi:ribosomal protein S4
MRLINKYKNFSNNNTFLKSFPFSRLLKFKRPKWHRVQQLLKKKFFFKKKIYNNILLKARSKKWEKLNLYYKEGLLLKRAILLNFDNSLSIKYFKKHLLKKSLTTLNVFLKTLIKPFFKLDILLWKLCFFNSTFEAKQAFLNNQISINSVKIKKTLFLSKGDIIKLGFLNKKIRPLNLNFLNSFIEVDYYTNTIVILKDLEEINVNDTHFFFKENIPLKKFLDYVRLN